MIDPKARRNFDISIGIPAYGRCQELRELLRSIYAQTILPAEITICEDMSLERETIRAIVQEWRGKFASESCAVNYIENRDNLGYDGNLRKVIASSHSTWVMLIGNDDLLLPHCVQAAEDYLGCNGQLRVISRSFARFTDDISSPVGTSSLSKRDTTFDRTSSSAKMIFRSCGFVGGLIVSRNWAVELTTTRYDGTLFYQIYLAAEAFCGDGIGYIGKAIVGGRGDNPPLFGAASSEQDVHVPGSYTPKGRAKMWSSVMTITKEVGESHNVDLLTETRTELEVRQSFHVFEMMVGTGRESLDELRDELQILGLFDHFVPRTFYWINRIFGSHARLFYVLVRLLMQ